MPLLLEDLRELVLVQPDGRSENDGTVRGVGSGLGIRVRDKG